MSEPGDKVATAIAKHRASGEKASAAVDALAAEHANRLGAAASVANEGTGAAAPAIEASAA